MPTTSKGESDAPDSSNNCKTATSATSIRVPDDLEKIIDGLNDDMFLIMGSTVPASNASDASEQGKSRQQNHGLKNDASRSIVPGQQLRQQVNQMQAHHQQNRASPQQQHMNQYILLEQQQQQEMMRYSRDLIQMQKGNGTIHHHAPQEQSHARQHHQSPSPRGISPNHTCAARSSTPTQHTISPLLFVNGKPFTLNAPISVGSTSNVHQIPNFLRQLPTSTPFPPPSVQVQGPSSRLAQNAREKIARHHEYLLFIVHTIRTKKQVILHSLQNPHISRSQYESLMESNKQMDEFLTRWSSSLQLLQKPTAYWSALELEYALFTVEDIHFHTKSEHMVANYQQHLAEQRRQNQQVAVHSARTAHSQQADPDVHQRTAVRHPESQLSSLHKLFPLSQEQPKNGLSESESGAQPKHSPLQAGTIVQPSSTPDDPHVRETSDSTSIGKAHIQQSSSEPMRTKSTPQSTEPQIQKESNIPHETSSKKLSTQLSSTRPRSHRETEHQKQSEPPSEATQIQPPHTQGNAFAPAQQVSLMDAFGFDRSILLHDFSKDAADVVKGTTIVRRLPTVSVEMIMVLERIASSGLLNIKWQAKVTQLLQLVIRYKAMKQPEDLRKEYAHQIADIMKEYEAKRVAASERRRIQLAKKRKRVVSSDGTQSKKRKRSKRSLSTPKQSSTLPPA